MEGFGSLGKPFRGNPCPSPIAEAGETHYYQEDEGGKEHYAGPGGYVYVPADVDARQSTEGPEGRGENQHLPKGMGQQPGDDGRDDDGGGD